MMTGSRRVALLLAMSLVACATPPDPAPASPGQCLAAPRSLALRGPSGLPCSPPPFGALVAVDLSTGTRRWEVPLGTLQALVGDQGVAPPEWGSINLGGPIVTASGLVFMAGTLDRSIRAFDIETGRELWRGALPSSARATPMTWRSADGRQFVAVAVGGGGPFGRGDWIVAFALPVSP